MLLLQDKGQKCNNPSDVFKRLWLKLGSSWHLAARGCRHWPTLGAPMSRASSAESHGSWGSHRHGGLCFGAESHKPSGGVSGKKGENWDSQTLMHKELDEHHPTLSIPLFYTSKCSHKYTCKHIQNRSVYIWVQKTNGFI